MEIKVNKGEKNTYSVEIVVPAVDVEAGLKEALEHEAESVEIKGFRKGKAPLDLVKEQMDPSKLRGHVLNHMLPGIYSRVITENKIRPIVDPKFEIIQFEDEKDLILKMILIEKPNIVLKDFKPALKEKYKSKNAKKEETSKEESKEKREDKVPSELSNEEVVEVIVKNSEVDLADELVKEETDRMLANMIDQINKMGINLEQYLSSVKKSAEEMRAQYMDTAKRTLHADFAVTEIAFAEKIVITDEDVTQSIGAIPDEKTREMLSTPEQKMYVKAILTKAKTLEKLAEMAKEG